VEFGATFWLKDLIVELDPLESRCGGGKERHLTEALVLSSLLARLFRYGRLSHHGGFINLSTGHMSPLPVNPEVWRRIVRQEFISRAKRPS
jgi:hypothetical protein